MLLSPYLQKLRIHTCRPISSKIENSYLSLIPVCPYLQGLRIHGVASLERDNLVEFYYLISMHLKYGPIRVVALGGNIFKLTILRIVIFFNFFLFAFIASLCFLLFCNLSILSAYDYDFC
jgi:hypothetical protein